MQKLGSIGLAFVLALMISLALFASNTFAQSAVPTHAVVQTTAAQSASWGNGCGYGCGDYGGHGGYGYGEESHFRAFRAVKILKITKIVKVEAFEGFRHSHHGGYGGCGSWDC